ncbi:MAG: hypothetical protein ACI97K_002308 [Glaciecola sp.]|jgi:hypothetical protein
MFRLDNTEKLSLSVRIIIGILGLPSLLLGFMLISDALNSRFDTIGAFEIIYSLVGVFAIYVALSGKKFF